MRQDEEYKIARVMWICLYQEHLAMPNKIFIFISSYRATSLLEAAAVLVLRFVTPPGGVLEECSNCDKII